jgi:hypothetical protein
MLNRLSLNRIGLNRIGLNRIGKPSGGSSDRPYIDPKVLDSLRGVWIMDQNTNESESRNIIKNKIADRGGDLELLNFGYKLNSGYNGYAIDFTSWSRLIGIKVFSNKFIIENKAFNCAYYVRDKGEDLDEFKAKITNHTDGIIRYGYINQNGVITYLDITPDNSNRVITFPKSYNSIEGLPNHICGFQTPMFVNTGLTIEQLPLYEGALVTDGKDDMIVSQKTVQEMLGGSNVCTVVSMITHISGVGKYNFINNGRIQVTDYVGQTFIASNNSNNLEPIIIELGDKGKISKFRYPDDLNYKLSICGNEKILEMSSCACYFVFMFNKVNVPIDWIRQVIAYFKLDKYVTPQVIYDVKRQGLTNDTPAADWYLKDFSGNGHDMQLYNYAKKGNSGIGKYETDFTTWSKGHFTDNVNIGSSNIEITGTLTASSILINTNPTSIYNVEIHSPNKSITIYFQYNDVDGTGVKRISLVEGINKLPSVSDSLFVTSDPLNSKGITITQIPDYEGALVSDGKDDYGKAEGLPILKDYTVAADRAIVDDLPNNADGGVFTKGIDYISGAFVFDYKDQVYSFGVSNDKILDTKRFISYQSKYVNNGKSISAGTTTDINPLLLAKLGSKNDRYSALALYSMLLFPYSLSEFLLERQLKKYKLGTLYPDMVEFRPIVKSNVQYDKIVFHYENKEIENGTYFAIGSEIVIYVRLSSNPSNEIKTLMVNGTPAIFMSHDTNTNVYQYKFYLSDKSPQKIDITIDEYIRFEDIVQPYPMIVNLSQDGKILTWGDKLKVGSEVTFVNHVNLLPEIYAASGEILCNGTIINGWNTPIIVAKSMVFTNVHTWKLNTTEPHAIYSPQKLNIPNSSLKILGYIPDLTGKRNHGKLNNFAYAGMSGANGYTENYSVWKTANTNIVITDSKIKATGKLTSNFIAYTTASINKHKIKITGIPNGDSLRYSYRLNGVGKDFYIVEDGVYDIPASDAFSSGSGFIISNLSSYNWSNVTIEEIGEHEGSVCFDGTDDHITIPTLAHGGKCVMMKVNWSNGGMLYDQRLNSSAYTFGILTSEALPAYNARNNGSTYIDGILNTSIIPTDLSNITHNITAVNDATTDNSTVSPRLGVSVTNATFSNMSLYEFMLFPEIPSEDEIKKLNDVMGIEGGYVESPNYYWDAYGKKNTDTDRNLIADQVSKDVANALEVKNVAYNSESGYGYGKSNFISIMESSQQFVDIIDDYNFIIKATPHNNNQFFAQVNTPKLIPNNYIRFKVSGIPEDFKMVFGYDYVEGGTNEYSHIIDKNGVYSYDSFNVFYTSFRAYTGYTDLTGLNIKVEFLDYHPNGLLLDGVEDHAVNTVIPAVTDFTVIAKRSILDTGVNSAFVIKGTSNTYNKAAFMLEFKSSASIQIGSFGALSNRQNIPDLITYMTPTDYNKAGISKGTAIDEKGLIMGKYSNTYYWKGVFYKMMLYTKTIDQLSINMLKNLFERDELIDVNNPIFKKQ